MTPQKSQRERFIEAAREAECDEDPAAFDRVFAKVVSPKSGKPNPKPKAPNRA